MVIDVVDTNVRAMEDHLLSKGHQHHTNTTNEKERTLRSPVMANQLHKRHRMWWQVKQIDHVQDVQDKDHTSTNWFESAVTYPKELCYGIESSKHTQTRNTRSENEEEDCCAMEYEQITSGDRLCNHEEIQSNNCNQVNSPFNHNHQYHHHYTTSHLERQVNHPSQRCHVNTNTHEKTFGIGSMRLSRKKSHTYSITDDLPLRVLITIFLHAMLNHPSSSQQHNDIYQYRTIFDKAQQQVSRILPSPITVAALVLQAENAFECRLDNDCEDTNRICHESRCICKRSRPIDDKGTCLPLAVVGELCSLNDQCLGNSACIEGTCACGSNTISLYNPSTKIYYCHPKRDLHGECSHDAQCPNNAFCSTDKYGCLCQNGYGPVTVRGDDGAETTQCLPKTCSVSRDCESEFHTCDDNHCVCLASHFDPHTAECYKFGSTGGIVDGVDQLTRPAFRSRNGTATRVIDRTRDNYGASGSSSSGGGFFTKTVKDLIRNSSDISVWLIVILLSVSTLLLLTLMVMIARKYYLGYCWTAHKKEYEPNNDNGQKNQEAFSKNSINNKSFRKRTNVDRETDDDDDDDNGEDHDHHDRNDSANDDTAAADKSHLVNIPSSKTRNTTINTTTTTMSTIKTIGQPNGTINGGDHKLVNGNSGAKASKLNGFNDQNRYVNVDIPSVTNNEGDHRLFENGHDFATTNGYYHHQQQQQQQLLSRPLASSTSTPV